MDVKLAGRVAVALMMALLGGGCATLFASGPQEITLNSNPPGATYQYGPFSGKTPATIEVPRKTLANFATFSLQGYDTNTVPVVTGIQGSTWWDILFWPGFIVDFVTGNANKVETPMITADLSPKAGTPAAGASSNAAAPSPAAANGSRGTAN